MNMTENDRNEAILSKADSIMRSAHQDCTGWPCDAVRLLAVENAKLLVDIDELMARIREEK